MRSYYVRQGEKDLFKGSPHVLEVVSYRVIRFLPCEFRCVCVYVTWRRPP